jgi:hypothetical protein
MNEVSTLSRASRVRPRPLSSDAPPPIQEAHWGAVLLNKKSGLSADLDTGGLSLTAGFIFGRRRCLATVFFGLLHIPGLFPRHVSRIVMEFAIRVLAGLLPVGIFVVCHADPSPGHNYRSSTVAGSKITVA